MKYNLKIELLSDLCVSDGSSYNSFIDTDVCHDSYGFPFIPSKRLKGCFRESCLELRDWGWGEQFSLEELFGTEGKDDNKAKFTISNAYLKDVEQYKKIIDESNNLLLFHPQNILNKYTYVRYQTRVNYETGIAKEHNFRTIRVVNKGNVFMSEVEMDEKYFNYFEQITSVTTNIGINRTRGLGEVRITISKKDNNVLDDIKSVQIDSKANMLHYHIELKESIVCKGFNSNDLNTMDYFEGNKILGVIANGLKSKDKDLVEFLNNDELFISNAYIEYDGQRMSEMPASYYTFKNVKDFCFDSSQFKEVKDKQLSKMKHSYVYLNGNQLRRATVAISNSYHHSRPVDKSYGHSLESKDDTSKFFSISSIDEGQRFGGYITGSHEQIETIYNILNNKECRMGFGRNSEFGKVKISVDKPEETSPTRVIGKKLMVKLESPVIIYGKNASYSVNQDDLIKEISEILNINEKVKPKVYLGLTKIGGFNVTWGCRKPIIQAFDKGTVLVYEFEDNTEIILKEKTYIGERIQEGYGEISVKLLDDAPNVFDINKDLPNLISNNSFADYKIPFIKGLSDSLFNQYINSAANEYASKDFENNIDRDKNDIIDYRPVISNMLLIWKNDYDTFDHFDKAVIGRFDKSLHNKQRKKELAEIIKNNCKNETNDMIENFKQIYRIQNLAINNEKVKLDYIHEYLLAMKHLIRAKEHKNG